MHGQRDRDLETRLEYYDILPSRLNAGFSYTLLYVTGTVHIIYSTYRMFYGKTTC